MDISRNITVTSSECHSVSIQLDHQSNSLRKQTTNKTPKLCITGPLWGLLMDSPYNVPVMWRFVQLLHSDNDVILGTIASQITSLAIVYSTVYSGADQIKHQSSASLAFVREIHRGPMNSPHKWPVTRKMFPFDDVIIRWFIMSSFQKLCPSPHSVHGLLSSVLDC